MGLARELSMGGGRKRSRHGANTGAYAKVRRILAADKATVDAAALLALLEEIGGTRERFRYAEGVVYAEGCALYRELTGKEYGPAIGTY